jgi:hypothetical protein
MDRETLSQVVRARVDVSVVLGCMSLPVLFERAFSQLDWRPFLRVPFLSLSQLALCFRLFH